MIRLASIALLQVFILGTAHAQLVKADPDAEAPLESTVIDARMLVYPADGPTTLGPTHGRGSSAQFVFTGDEPEADAPSDVVFTADGSTIIIAHRESRNLILWDAATRTFLGEVPISGAAQGLDVTPDGTTAVVANLDNDTVSIVDLGSLAETSIVPAGLNPGVVKISPAGDVAAVSITGSSELAVLDIATATIVRTIPNIGYWMRVSFSPEPPASSIQFSEIHFIDNDRVINIDRFNNELQIANVRTGSVTRIPVAPNGMDVSVSLDGTTAAITHTSSTRLITLVDLASETVSGTVSTPEDLWGEIALNTDGSKAVVAVLNASRVVDLTTGTVGPSLFTASVNQMITTHDGQYVLCVGYYGALIGFASGSVEVFTNVRVSTEFGAVSAVDHRAAMCSTTFGDDLVVANTNGSSGGLEAFQLTGPLPEGDRCRTIAISPDGTRAAGVSIFSDTLAVIDTASGAVTGIAPLGQRPSAVAITPDGTRAVVGNLDSSYATIVDLATATSTNVTISTRAGAVAISPDGQYAYVAVVAGGDGVWRIDLTSNTVAGPKIPTGDMGSVGYSYWQASDMKLSNDGSILAVAGSFTDEVSLIRTSNWTLLSNVPVGDFPAMLAFSPDDTRLYVANRNDDTVSVIDLTGIPGVIATFAAGDSPWQMIDDGAGRLWVNNWGDSQVALYDTSSGARLTTLTLPDRAVGMHLDAAANRLYIANGISMTTFGGTDGWVHSEDGRVSVYDTTTFGLVDTIALGYAPSAMAWNTSTTVGALAAPEADGALIVSLGAGPCNQADLAEPFGTLDFFDVLTFLSLLTAQDPAADFNADGLFDFFDVLAFLQAFSAGCP